KSTSDLYEAFEAACRSEELFREELSRYAELEDGVPQITPIDVPPLVAQHIGWLRPAASNKMYNAQLVERRSPGQRLEPTGYPRAPEKIAANTAVLLPLVASASTEGRLLPSPEASRGFPVRHQVIDHSSLLSLLEQLQWQPEDHFQADLAWLRKLDSSQIEDWVVLLPQHTGKGATATIEGAGPLSVFRRRRRRDPLFGAISDPKHRPAAHRIAGSGGFADPLADELHSPRRGAILVYPVVELEEDDEVPAQLVLEDVIFALVFVAPESTGSPDGSLIRFVVRNPRKSDDPIVDSDVPSGAAA
ncbi:MAG TPA: hypothetical protein VLC07_00575, partial [Solirubrobacterales bacterium]|nr:hypothetical protein [Solirubrobacterales bacterium]